MYKNYVCREPTVISELLLVLNLILGAGFLHVTCIVLVQSQRETLERCLKWSRIFATTNFTPKLM